MANSDLFVPKLLRLEGGFVNRADDRGGPTNMGVTLSTWRNVGYDKDGDGDIDTEDIRQLSSEDAMSVMKTMYWNRWKADRIKNQSVAEILVDWVWASGKWGIIIPQRILNIPDDGIVGEKTIQALNEADQKELHLDVWIARKKFFDDLVVNHPDQIVNLHGWMNRLKEFKFLAT